MFFPRRRPPIPMDFLQRVTHCRLNLPWLGVVWKTIWKNLHGCPIYIPLSHHKILSNHYQITIKSHWFTIFNHYKFALNDYKCIIKSHWITIKSHRKHPSPWPASPVSLVWAPAGALDPRAPRMRRMPWFLVKPNGGISWKPVFL